MATHKGAGAAPPPLAHWLKPGEVAAILGCSVCTVKRLENKRLHPRLDAAGVHHYDPVEVHALEHKARYKATRAGKTPERTPGDIAACVFELLDREAEQNTPDYGAAKRRIVIQLRIEPELCDQLYEAWATPPDESLQRRRDADADERQRRADERAQMLEAGVERERLRAARATLAADQQMLKTVAAATRRRPGAKEDTDR